MIYRNIFIEKGFDLKCWKIFYYFKPDGTVAIVVWCGKPYIP